MKTESSIEIAAQPEAVWPFLVEPPKILQWCITFKKFEYTSEQRSGVGTEVYIEEKANGPLMKMDFRFTEWIQNEKIVFQMTSSGMLKSYELHWTITNSPSGCTFTFMEDVQFSLGIVGKLIDRMSRSSSHVFVDKMLNELKSLVEK
jgi:uncharacterized protein YndB with AHSA1/START domain